VSVTVAPAALDRAPRDRCAGNQRDGYHGPQVLSIVVRDELRIVHGVHGDAARRVRCVDTLGYAVPTWRSCENVIETLSEPGGGPLKARDFPPLKPAKKYDSFWTHDRWRPFRFGP
jgi:hypothetical protein